MTPTIELGTAASAAVACLVSSLLIFFGLWNFKLGPYHWLGLVALLCGIVGLAYGFNLFLDVSAQKCEFVSNVLQLNK